MRAATLMIVVATALSAPGWMAARALAQERTDATPEAAPATPPSDHASPAADAQGDPNQSAPTQSAPTQSAPTQSGPALSAPAEREDGRIVLLLAPASLRAEWTAALQIELAPRGFTVVPMDPPDGPTALIRDAEAQRLVLERHADSAVLVVMGEPAHSVRVLTPDSAAPRVAPVAVEADPRTAALIAVSLWDEQPLPVAPPETPWYRRASTPPPRELDFESPPRTPEPEPDRLIASFRAGTGGFGYLNDRRAFVGSLARIGGGLRYGFFESEFLFDGGLMLDQVTGHGGEAQPMVRGCLGAGGVTKDSAQFHLGLRACAGYAEARTLQRDPFDPGFAPGFVSDAGGVLLDFGAYVAVSFLARDGLRLHIRATLGGGFLEALDAGIPRIAATLSTVLAVM